MYPHKGKRSRQRRAAVAVLTCLSLTGILFLSAMAIDNTSLMAARRHAQNCCDAAALAGTLELAQLTAAGSTATLSQIQTAVYNSATNNGFTNGTNCTITVNWPPQSGNYQNNSSVEVYFSFSRNNLMVSGSGSPTVRAVASCASSSAPSLPLLLLDPTGANAFLINGGKLTEGTPAIQVNSNNATAATVEGVSPSEAVAQVRVVGGSSGTFSPSAQSGGAPLANPYALVPTPSTSGMTTYTQSSYTPNSSGDITLQPGYYPNGIYCINGGNVTFEPGLYYIANGNCWINTTGTVTGDGVTLYHAGPNTSAELYTNYGLNVGFCFCLTDNNYSITPPTTGPYAGISLYQGPSCTAEAFYDFWGTGSLNVGMQYFPNSTLRCWAASDGGTINCDELVANDFALKGTHEIYGNTYNNGYSVLTWNASRSSSRPVSSVYLVE